MERETYTTGVRRKRLLWGILAVVVILGCAVGVWVLRVGNALAGTGGGGIKKVVQAYEDPRSLFPGKNRITVLVLGKDYNRDRKGMPYTKGSRSDTMMLIAVDLTVPKITAVSIPRDSKITAADGITDKFNSIIVRGGPPLVEQTIAEHFGATPDYYVVLKPDAIRSIVTALGGIDVTALDDMNYDDNWGQMHVHIPKGPAHLDGPAAEGFVRFRETKSSERTHRGPNLEEGDFRRTARQQEAIHAMVQAAMRPSNLASAASIIETGFKQIQTDMTQPQILALSRIFQQAGGGKIEGGSLPGQDSMAGGVYYWILDENRSREMISWLVNGDALAGKALPRVAVYNSSKIGSAAKSIASMLYAEGYDAFNGGGRPPFAETSQITFRTSLFEDQANDLATRLGLPKATKDLGNPLDTWSPEIRIIVGTDLATKYQPIGNTTEVNVAPSKRSSRGRKKRGASTPAPTPDVDVNSQPVAPSDSSTTGE
jgi:LCP family protein required for cell wall assembly